MRVEPLCSCPVGRKPAPKFMGGGPRPEWQHLVACQVYRRGWRMPQRAHEVSDPVLIDGRPCIITRTSELYAHGIADWVAAP